jgi:hypothetical protein
MANTDPEKHNRNKTNKQNQIIRKGIWVASHKLGVV